MLLAGCFEAGREVLPAGGQALPGLKTGRWLVWVPHLRDFDHERPVRVAWDAAGGRYLLTMEPADSPGAAFRAVALEDGWWLVQYQDLLQGGRFVLLARMLEGGLAVEVPVVDDAAAAEVAREHGVNLAGARVDGEPAALRAFMRAMTGRLRADLPAFAYAHTDHAEAFRRARR